MTAADDVVDAYIHEEWCTPLAPCPACVQEPQARIDAALRIHRPCHDDGTEPWKCEHGHYDEACETGIPDRPAVCVACTDACEEHLPHPCPTAKALGAQPIESREDNQHDDH